MGDEKNDSAKTSSEKDTPETDISIGLNKLLQPSCTLKKSMTEFYKEASMLPEYKKNLALLSRKAKKLHEDNILHLQSLKEKQDMVEKLEKSLLEESDRIRAMDDQLNDLRKRNQNLNSVMKEKDEQIQNLQSENMNLHQQIRELQVRIKKYVIKVDMLKQNIDDTELCEMENIDLSEDLELSSDENDAQNTNETNSIQGCTHCADMEVEILYQKALRSYLDPPRLITPLSEEYNKTFCSVSIQVNLLPDDTCSSIVVSNPKVVSGTGDKEEFPWNKAFDKILSVFKERAEKILKDVNSHGFKYTNKIHKVNLSSQDALATLIKLTYNHLYDVTNSVQGLLRINSKQFKKTDINCITRKTKKKKLTEELFDSDESDQRPARKRRKKEEIQNKNSSSRGEDDENTVIKMLNNRTVGIVPNKPLDDQSHVSSGYVSESVSNNNDIEINEIIKSPRRSYHKLVHSLLKKAEKTIYPKKILDDTSAKIFMDNLRKGNVKRKTPNIKDNDFGKGANLLEDIIHDMDNIRNMTNHDEDSLFESRHDNTNVEDDLKDLKSFDNGMAEIDDSNCESANEDVGMSETDYLSEDDSRSIRNTKNLTLTNEIDGTQTISHELNKCSFNVDKTQNMIFAPTDTLLTDVKNTKNRVDILTNGKDGTHNISQEILDKCSFNVGYKTRDMISFAPTNTLLTNIKNKDIILRESLDELHKNREKSNGSEELSTKRVSQISAPVNYIKDLDRISNSSRDTESTVENVFRFYTLRETNSENDEGISGDKMQNSDDEISAEIALEDVMDDSSLTYEYTKAPISILAKILEKYSGSWRALKKQFVNGCRSLEYHGMKENKIKIILVYYFNSTDWLPSIPKVEFLLKKVESEHLSMMISFCLLRLMDNNWNDILKNKKDSVERLVTLLYHLGQNDEIFLDDILKSLSYEIFRFEKRKDIFIMFLSQVYIALCIKLKKHAALNTLLLDSFYCLQYGCMEITMQLLKVYPSILQVYKPYEKENLLHGTMKYYIIHCKLNNVKILNELKKIIKYDYKYAPGVNNADELLQKIMNEVRRAPNLNLYLSTILLSKQENKHWVINTLVNKCYVELLQQTWIDYSHTDLHDSEMNQFQQSNRTKLKLLKFCLEVLGAVCRTFNEENKDKVSTIIIFLRTMLGTENLPPDLQETIVSCLIRISRHQYNAVADIILRWTPRFLPSLEFINKLKRFVTMKNADYWKCKVK